MFGERLKQERAARGLSLRELASRVPCDPGLLSKLENGRKAPSEKITARLDLLLGAHGELIGASRLDTAATIDTEPWATSELLQRIQASDTTPATLETLRTTVLALCCAYTTTPALTLRAEVHAWLKRLGMLTAKPIGLSAHREILSAAGWLALLAGCLEYDAGMGSSAEATRVTARQLGSEADQPEVVAWAHEMSAWFALTQGRYSDALRAATAGLTVTRRHQVSVQLYAHQGKALGRLGDPKGAWAALGEGRALLDRLPAPERPDAHFTTDTGKYHVWAKDVFRVLGDDDLAAEHARIVVRDSTGPDGNETQPMRVAESRLTLATVAARRGELDEAMSEGMAALTAPRKSLPSLLLVAGELEGELVNRYPGEGATGTFQAALRTLRA